MKKYIWIKTKYIAMRRQIYPPWLMRRCKPRSDVFSLLKACRELTLWALLLSNFNKHMYIVHIFYKKSGGLKTSSILYYIVYIIWYMILLTVFLTQSMRRVESKSKCIHYIQICWTARSMERSIFFFLKSHISAPGAPWKRKN